MSANVVRTRAGWWLMCALVGCGAAPPSYSSELSLLVEGTGFRYVAGGERFLAEGETETHSLTMPSGVCWALLVRAGRAMRDLDVAVYRSDGDLVAEDVEPDAHPSVFLCSGDTRRELYFHVAAYEGAGPYRWGVFVGPESGFAQLATRVGGRPGRASSVPAIDALRRTLRRRGFHERGAPRRIRLDAATTVTLGAELAEGQCAAYVAHSDDALEVRMEVRSRDGRRLVREASGTPRAVQYCEPGEGTLRIVAERGGWVWLHRFEGSSASVGGEAGLWLGERRPVGLRFGPLPEGWRAEEEIARDLAAAEVWLHVIRVEADNCVRVEAAGPPRIRRVELRLGGVVQYRRLQTCEVGQHEVLVIPEGSGRVRLRVARSTSALEEAAAKITRSMVR